MHKSERVLRDFPSTSMLLRLLHFFLFLLLLTFSRAAPGSVIQNDGAWTWFNDPRAMVAGGKLFFGYVRVADGKTALGVYNPTTNTTTSPLWTSTWSETDDHNNPALLKLTDGRLMTFYAHHGSTNYFNYRTTTAGADPALAASWGAEQSFTSSAGETYANPYQLTGESGRIYNFSRNLNYNPTFVYTDNLGTSWSTPQRLIATGTGSTRPYVKYCSNGSNRIDVLYTDGHPRDNTNSLYHMYYQGGSLYKTDGTFLKTLANAPLLHDSGERGSVIYQYSAAASSDPNNFISTGRAWCWDIVYDANGNPACVFSVQRDGAAWTDDRIFYYYAKYIPGTGWRKRFIAQAGRPLYSAEDDYAGGICIDPNNVDVVYLSSNAATPFSLSDITNVPLAPNSRYEIYRGSTADGGLTFSWTGFTQNSTVDQLRPYVPRGHNYNYALIWFEGTYTTYTNWSSNVRALLTNSFTPPSLYYPPSLVIASPFVSPITVVGTTSQKLRLKATASDDGLPSALTYAWTQVSGPAGGASIANSAASDTTVQFSQLGTYVFRMTCSDGGGSVSADTTINVVAAPTIAGTDAALWLKLDQSSGTSVTDSSTNNLVATLSGTGTWNPSTGKINGALATDGTSGLVTVTDAATSKLDNTTAFSLSFWFKANALSTSGGAAQGLVAKRDGITSNNNYTIFLQTDGKINVDIETNNDRFVSNTTFATGNWYHIALTYDGTQAAASRVKFYVNGLLELTVSESSASISDTSSTFKLANTHTGATNFFNGMLDDVRFYRRAVSDAEVADLALTSNAVDSVITGTAPSTMSLVAAPLAGAINQNGNPSVPTITWSKVSGPGNVTFSNASSATSDVTFSQEGTYILRLTATNNKGEMSNDLTVNVAPNMNVYADWIASFYPATTDPALIATTSDPDGDGLTNQMEFNLGMIPNNIFSCLKMSIEKSGNDFTLTINRVVTTGTFHIESSTDLQSWTAEPALNITANQDNFTLPKAKDGVKRFYRAVYTLP